MADKKKQKDEVLDDLKGIALVMGGVVIGTLIDKGATKILKLDRPSAGLIGKLKPFLSPAIRVIGGGAGAYLIPNKTARLLLGGVAVSGAASAVDQVADKILKKDSGDGVKGVGSVSIDDYILDEVEEDEPNLPELTGGKEEYLELEQAPEAEIRRVSEDEYEDFDDAEII